MPTKHERTVASCRLGRRSGGFMQPFKWLVNTATMLSRVDIAQPSAAFNSGRKKRSHHTDSVLRRSSCPCVVSPLVFGEDPKWVSVQFVPSFFPASAIYGMFKHQQPFDGSKIYRLPGISTGAAT